MRPLLSAALSLPLLSAAVAQQQPLGTWGVWGAFRGGERCYAIARPVETTIPGTDPFAAVGYWPRRGGGGQLHVRLSREQRVGSAVLLRVDGRTVQLIGQGWDAWLPDARGDAALIAAMRTGLTMAVETRASSGALIRDRYRLRGAATAIDAAALACARP